MATRWLRLIGERLGLLYRRDGTWGIGSLTFVPRSRPKRPIRRER